MNKPLVYNLLGSIFDKGLPLLIASFLTKFMTSYDFGKWSLFYTFILISNSLSAAPILTIFSRKYYNQENGEKRMILYMFPLILGLQILSFFIYYSFFGDITLMSVFEMPIVLLMNLYMYYALFLRFQNKDYYYMLQSLIRLVLFIILLIVPITLNSEVTYNYLIISFLLSFVPSLFKSFNKIRIDWSVSRDSFREFFSLSNYGLTTSLTNGLDKFVIASTGMGLSFLGYYSFLYTISNTPTIIVEALKKSMNPIMYKEYSQLGNLSKVTLKKRNYIYILLFFLQGILPIFAFYILKKLNFINPEFSSNVGYLYIGILSVGFYFHSMYHFINPEFFFFRKSHYLIFIQCIAILLYFAVLALFDIPDIMPFLFAKTALFISLVILTFWISNKVNFKK